MGNGAANTPKVKGAFPGVAPAPPARATPAGPARLEDEDTNLDTDTGAGTGLLGLWNAFMNGEYGGETDFYYYGDDYGNQNQQQYSSYYQGNTGK